jgi:GTPase-activating protein BEM2
VFPPSSYHDVMNAMSKLLCQAITRRFFFFFIFFYFFAELENLDERLLNIRSVVQGLPQANFDILRRVSEHLDKYVAAMLSS